MSSRSTDLDDWETRYHTLMDKAGDLLTERLFKIPVPFCLMCAELNPNDCHRSELLGEELLKINIDTKHILHEQIETFICFECIKYRNFN